MASQIWFVLFTWTFYCFKSGLTFTSRHIWLLWPSVEVSLQGILEICFQRKTNLKVEGIKVPLQIETNSAASIPIQGFCLIPSANRHSKLKVRGIVLSLRDTL